MIQKNRIMTKKGIIIFDRNIDVEKTQENGKKVCEVYAPLIQQRIRLKMRLPLHTGSLIQVSSDIKSGNGIESNGSAIKMTIQTGTNEKRSRNGDLDGQNIVTWL